MGPAGSLALIGDFKSMDKRFLRGARFHRYGVTLYVGIGIPIPVLDEEMAALFSKHLDHITAWITEQPQFEVIFVSYNEVMRSPIEQLQRINQFLGEGLNVDTMAAVVDPDLYRQRQ